MATPLWDTLQAYTARGRVSYHTPGHKGQAAFLEPLMTLSMDLTELDETGSLYDGGDAIEAAEREAANVFGADKTLFSAGGCTLCMQTMLALAAERGNKVLMGRNAHRSAVHAAVLLDLDVRWLTETSPETVEAALAADPAVRTVYVTSPDYYGRLCDIAALSVVAKRHDAALIVDNAHGTHLEAFGMHPLQLGADATADSAHKTLPVLTGGAYLQIAKDGVFADVPRERIKSLMGLFGSTSPSFQVLASLDMAQHWWQSEGRSAFRALCEKRKEIDLLLWLKDWHPNFSLADPVRLTIDVKECDARQIAQAMRQYGCEPEYVDSRYIVLLLSPFHTEEQWRQLYVAIDTAPPVTSVPDEEPLFSAGMPRELPQRVMSLRAASLAPSETIDCAQAQGRISAQTISVCPPGVAVIMPGEAVSASLCTRLVAAGYETITVVKK